MQQRVGLARALANNPDILLMDEAFSALDPLIRREMQDELLDHRRQSMSVPIIFITHTISMRPCVSVTMCYYGWRSRLYGIGTSEEI